MSHLRNILLNPGNPSNPVRKWERCNSGCATSFQSSSTPPFWTGLPGFSGLNGIRSTCPQYLPGLVRTLPPPPRVFEPLLSSEGASLVAYGSPKNLKFIHQPAPSASRPSKARSPYLRPAQSSRVSDFRNIPFNPGNPVCKWKRWNRQKPSEFGTFKTSPFWTGIPGFSGLNRIHSQHPNPPPFSS